MKAGALFYSLFLCLFLLIIMGMILLADAYKRIAFVNLENDKRLIYNVESGINYSISGQNLKIDESNIALFSSDQDSVSIKKKRWGAYKLFKISAFNLGKIREKTFLVGNSINHEFRRTVITDMSGVLNIGGAAEIEGAFNIPESQMKIVNFEGGFPNVHKQPVYLRQIDEDYSIDSDFLNSCRELFEGQRKEYHLFHSVKDFQDVKSVKRSFSEESLFIYAQDDLYIDKNYDGNIILYSEGTVFINSHASLHDVRIYGKSIEIENGFEGDCQLYARERIGVGENCKINYPSVLGVLYDQDEVEPEVVVEKGARLCGTIIMNALGKTSKKISIAGRVLIEGSLTGAVITDSYLENKGSINGTIVCSGFVTNTTSGKYVNHLIDGKINIGNGELPFIFPSVLTKQKELNVIDWFY